MPFECALDPAVQWVPNPHSGVRRGGGNPSAIRGPCHCVKIIGHVRKQGPHFKPVGHCHSRSQEREELLALLQSQQGKKRQRSHSTSDRTGVGTPSPVLRLFEPTWGTLLERALGSHNGMQSNIWTIRAVTVGSDTVNTGTTAIAHASLLIAHTRCHARPQTAGACVESTLAFASREVQLRRAQYRS